MVLLLPASYTQGAEIGVAPGVNVGEERARAYWPKTNRPEVRGIGAIAPAQPLPIDSQRPVPMQVEASLAEQCAQIDGAGRENGVALDLEDPWERLLIEACSGQEAGVVTVNVAHEEVYSFGLQVDDVPVFTKMGTLAYRPATMKPMLRVLPSNSGTVYTARSIVSRRVDGPSVALGTSQTRAPAWSSATRMSGVQLSNWNEGQNGILSKGEFGYSSMVGVLDYTDLTAMSGAYQYGATAGSTSVRYGATRALTLESHMEAAPALSSLGVGSAYSLGDFGVLRAGATQSEFEATTSTRTRLGYSVNVADAVTLGYTTDHIAAGYNDLADYVTGAAPSDQVRNTITAGIPLGQYGTFSGTYSGLRAGTVYAERRVGVSHTMALSPTVRVGWAADRDAVSGDYAMRMSLAMPVDSFLGRLGLYR